MAVLFRDIEFRYNQDVVVRGLNFHFQKGFTTCIYGKNGSGKSTIIKMMGKIEKPYSGDMVVTDKTLIFGFMLQFPEHLFYNGTVYEEVLSITNSKQLADDIFSNKRLYKIRDLSPFAVSDGQKRLIFIKSLISVSDVVVLDEPFASLDDESRSEIKKDILRCIKVGKTVIYTANRVADCDIAWEILRL